VTASAAPLIPSQTTDHTIYNPEATVGKKHVEDTIDVLLDEHRKFPPSEELTKEAHIKGKNGIPSSRATSINRPSNGSWAAA
jgi:hypothetical protein